MSLSQKPKPAKVMRSSKERREQHLGPPNGVERRKSLTDRRSENNVEVVTFKVAGHFLGLPVALVQEVIPEQKVTPIPMSPTDVRGLMNLRGQIVTVIDLRRRFQFESGDELKPKMNVIVSCAEEGFSLLVDSVGDVLPFGKHVFQPAPASLGGLWQEVCKSVVQLEEGLLIIVNLEKILGFSEKNEGAHHG